MFSQNGGQSAQNKQPGPEGFGKQKAPEPDRVKKFSFKGSRRLRKVIRRDREGAELG
jgi:hypothetical protein